MEGSKALALDALAAKLGVGMLRIDYSGTGSSSGSFEDGTLAIWLEETLAAVDQLTSGPLVLLGSSMGAWIAFHVALRRPERVRAVVGIAAAPDFTQWGFTDEDRATLSSTGHLQKVSRYAAEPSSFSRAFWQSADDLLLLDQEIAIDCPVRLLHGEHDLEVPLEVALRTMSSLRSGDVQLNLLKGGGHRLSQPHEIDAILQTVTNLLEAIA
jgi:pimeloyl-ACP methyl ester carboxylesterase